MKSPCLSGYKKQCLYLRIVRGPGDLPPEAEEILNFHVSRRLILSTLYHEKSMSFIKRTVYGLAPWSCRILEFSSRQKINFQPFILWKVHVFQVIKSFISQDCKGARGLAPWSLNNFCIFMLAGDWFWALSIMKEPSCISAYKRDGIHSV